MSVNVKFLCILFHHVYGTNPVAFFLFLSFFVQPNYVIQVHAWGPLPVSQWLVAEKSTLGKHLQSLVCKTVNLMSKKKKKKKSNVKIKQTNFSLYKFFSLHLYQYHILTKLLTCQMHNKSPPPFKNTLLLNQILYQVRIWICWWLDLDTCAPMHDLKYIFLISISSMCRSSLFIFKALTCVIIINELRNQSPRLYTTS